MAKKARKAPGVKVGVLATPAPITAAQPPSEVDRRRQEQQQAVRAALMSPIPKFYANSFAVAQTSSDATLILMLNNQPIGSVNMSYISMKSLISDLARTVEKFETATKQKIKTISEITKDLEKSLGKPI